MYSDDWRIYQLHIQSFYKGRFWYYDDLDEAKTSFIASSIALKLPLNFTYQDTETNFIMFTNFNKYQRSQVKKNNHSVQRQILWDTFPEKILPTTIPKTHILICHFKASNLSFDYPT